MPTADAGGDRPMEGASMPRLIEALPACSGTRQKRKKLANPTFPDSAPAGSRASPLGVRRPRAPEKARAAGPSAVGVPRDFLFRRAGIRRSALGRAAATWDRRRR